MIESAHNPLKIKTLRQEEIPMSGTVQAAHAVLEPSEIVLEADPSEAIADEFEAFSRRHPRVARDLLYILEVYNRCDRVPHGFERPNFEDAYTHVFGGDGRKACERCNPAFYREKTIVGSSAR
jgi:hypothetical protein